MPFTYNNATRTYSSVTLNETGLPTNSNWTLKFSSFNEHFTYSRTISTNSTNITFTGLALGFQYTITAYWTNSYFPKISNTSGTFLYPSGPNESYWWGYYTLPAGGPLIKKPMHDSINIDFVPSMNLTAFGRVLHNGALYEFFNAYGIYQVGYSEIYVDFGHDFSFAPIGTSQSSPTNVTVMDYPFFITSVSVTSDASNFSVRSTSLPLPVETNNLDTWFDVKLNVPKTPTIATLFLTFNITG